MNMTQESLSKLDDGFNSVRETIDVNAEQALRLVGDGLRGASAEQDNDIAKQRLQRLFCLSNEIHKALEDDNDDSAEIKLSKVMYEQVKTDAMNDVASVVPMSAVMDNIAKRFEEKKTDPIKKNEDSKVNINAPFASSFGVDLNTEKFDPKDADWGPDPDWKRS